MRVEIEKPSIDPKDLEIQKLKQKLEELRLKSERNTTNYYKELINYRQNIERQQKYQYDQSKI